MQKLYTERLDVTLVIRLNTLVTLYKAVHAENLWLYMYIS